MSNTPRTDLPLLAAAQAQKHVTHNEALLQLDALLFARVLDRDLTAPPASPADGDTYLVHAAASGDWTAEDGNLAYAVDGAWRFYAPFTGLSLYVVDESRLVVFNGTVWVDYASILDLQNVPLLGVNTAADATNKLATRSAALLFDNIGNGVQAKLNKHAAGDTASLLYQTNYSGRAEMGLCGDDDFHLKVSADGSSWFDGLSLRRANGHVGIGTTTDNAALTVAGAVAPDANNTRDLGASSFAFRNAYVGTQVVAAAGAAGTPSYSTAGDGDTGLYFPAANTVGVAAGGAQKLCVNAAGLGVGLTPGTYAFDVAGTGRFADWLYFANGKGLKSLGDFYIYDSGGNVLLAAGSHAYWGTRTAGNIYFSAGDAVGGTRVMQITASGAVANTLVLTGGNVAVNQASATCALDVNGAVRTRSYTVAGLPAAASAGAGARAFVTDATATAFLSTVAGGGANAVPVVSDGTNWKIG